MMQQNQGWIAPLALSLALALAGCGRESSAENAATVDAVRVGDESAVVVAQQEIRSGPLLSGSLEAENAAAVRAEVGGSVLQVYAEPGQAVQRGQLLARIEDAAQRDALLSAQSAARTAEQAVTLARRNHERTEALVAGGALAARDLEGAQLERSSAEAQLADARARLALARQQLENTRIRAPLGGRVSERPVNAGDVVSPGTALFTIVDPASLRLSASVPAEQLGALGIGDPVGFTVSGHPGREFAGRISRINPAADPATRQVQLFVTLPNPGGALVAGLFAEGRVESQARAALVVPNTALDESGPTPSVLRVRGGRAERAGVAIGLRDPQNERVEVTAGLAAGDTLLVGAARGITPGTPVRIGGTAPRTAAAPRARS